MPRKAVTVHTGGAVERYREVTRSPLAGATTPEEIHEAMLQLHGIRHVITLPSGGQVTVIKRTHELNTEEMTEYLERERAWAANQGLNIPDPGRCA